MGLRLADDYNAASRSDHCGGRCVECCGRHEDGRIAVTDGLSLCGLPTPRASIAVVLLLISTGEYDTSSEIVPLRLRLACFHIHNRKDSTPRARCMRRRQLSA